MSENSTSDDHGRAQALTQWFHSQLPGVQPGAGGNDFDINLVQGDASFRRYFRAQSADTSYILVDAPPDKENSQLFVDIAGLFRKQGVHVPEIFRSDLTQGFLCIKDFGDALLWSELKKIQAEDTDVADAANLYRHAFQELLLIQQVPTDKLPDYSEQLLQDEMELFRHWFCEGILKLKLGIQDNEILDNSFEFLKEAARSQTQLCVHRDYHSRNLLFLDKKSPESSAIGVIDFQDAVAGPYSYDLVSLLKDCYIAWPIAQVHEWALEYRNLALQQQLIDVTEKQFLRDFDLMGAQRHLKATGIFSRLYLRDQKITYLTDIPRTLSYLYQVTSQYKELADFHGWLKKFVMQDVERSILAISKANNRTAR